MTQAFVQGKRIPLTVLTVSPHVVVTNKTVDRDGYSAVVLAVGPKKLHEVLTEEVLEPKSEINLSELLVPGTIVDAMSKSKGKGTSGVMKRWGMHGGPRTHGQSDRLRAPGAIGSGTTPGRVYKGKKMAGHMGDRRVTTLNMVVVRVDTDRQLLLVRGAVPGCKGGDVIVRPAIKAPITESVTA